MAVGAGVGYRVNANIELWSETSWLWKHGGLAEPRGGTIDGLRQILQVKRFLGKGGNFFIAGEVRYKYFTYRRYDAFVDTASQTMVNKVLATSIHNVFGGALQLGWRGPLTRNGKLLLEITAGLGIKKKWISWPGIPKGYEVADLSVDINVWDEMLRSESPSLYLPGSLRLIYTFGKGLF